jgi:hypothetical protein
MAEWDDKTKSTVKKIPLLTVRAAHAAIAAGRAGNRLPHDLQENAGPRDSKEKWEARLKQVRGVPVPCGDGASPGRPTTASRGLQELQTLITYIQHNKESDTDWFTIQPSDGGKHWSGKCW